MTIARTTRAAFSKLWLLFFVVALLSAVGVGGVFFLRASSDLSVAGQLAYPVKRGPFVFDVTARGQIESSDNQDVRCEVKSSSGMKILWIIEEGEHVKEGDLLVKLDSSSLEDELTLQQITVLRSHASFIQAQNNHDTAISALNEYELGVYKEKKATLEKEVFVAEENLRRAEEYFEYSKRLEAKGYVTDRQLEADKFAVEKADKERFAAKTKLSVFQNYTKKETLKRLQKEVDSTKAILTAYKGDSTAEQGLGSHALELKKLEDIKQRIQLCRITAPQAGKVVYANKSGYRGRGEVQIEEGASVYNRQVIIRLPNQDLMQVAAKINESRVKMVKKGMKVSIRLDARPELELNGEVTHVSAYPVPTHWSSSKVKDYLTTIKIHDPPEELRTGFTAQVSIHAYRLDDVIQVPIQSVLEHDGKHYCFVKLDSGWNKQGVTIGRSNDSFVVIQEGLSEGQEVASKPKSLLSHEPSSEGPKKKSGRPAR